MRTLTLGVLWVCLMSSAAPALAQTESELDALRAELAQMRADYELRIAQLEKRLDEAETASRRSTGHYRTTGQPGTGRAGPMATGSLRRANG